MATTTETLIDGLGGKGFYAKAAKKKKKAIKDKDGNDIDSTYVKTTNLPAVDQTYNATSSNAQSGFAVAQALSGTGQVPTVQSTDDGKVLKATYSGGTGSFAWEPDSSNMPSPQAADKDKVLGVIDDHGTMGWVNQTQHIQSNWNEANSSSPAYIQNKPTIPNPANDATITVQIGSTSIGSFTTDQLANSTITIPEASTTVTGAMSSADKGKLDGIAVGAQVNVKPNWNAASGADAEILNKPDLSVYALSSSLAPVATSGSYNDLTDKPSIPTIPVNDVTVDGSSVVNSSGVAQIQLPTFTQVNADWTETDSSSAAYIEHKPNLATVATSGSYTDLSNKPTIPAAQVQSDWGESDTTSKAYINNKPDLSIYAQTTNLATVATSGSYTDLTDKPTIPSAANDSTVTVDMAGTQSGTNRSVGTFTVDQAAASTISIPVAVSGTKSSGTYTTHAQPGVMSYEDKEKLDDIEAGAEANVIESISVNGTAVQPDANKNVELTTPVKHVLTVDEVASDGFYLFDMDGSGNDPITYAELDEWYTNNDAIWLRSPYWDTMCYIDTLDTGSQSKYVMFTGSFNQYYRFGLKNGCPWSDTDPTNYCGVNGIKVNGTDVSADTDGNVDISVPNLPNPPSSSTGQFLKDDGTWATPAGKTYTNGDGIAISNQDVISVKTDGTTIHANASGELEVIGGSGEMNVVDGVKLEGASAVLPPDSTTKVVTIPNAIPTGTTGASNGLITADDQAKLDKAAVYQANPYDSSNTLLAQQFYVVTSDQQIIDIASQGVPNRSGTIFFRIG